MDNQEQKRPEPKVKVFGEEIKFDDKNRKRRHNHCCGGHHHGNGILGLIAISAGIILLLNNIGMVSWDIWQFIWPFWPALLILIGIEIILGRNWVSNIVTFIIALAIIICIVAYGLAQVNSPIVNNFPPEITNFINNNFR